MGGRLVLLKSKDLSLPTTIFLVFNGPEVWGPVS